MDRAQLKSLASLLCSDPNKTRFTDTQYNDALNRAQEQFAMDSRALFVDSSFSVVADTYNYSLPSDFLFEKSVVLNGFELKSISRGTLDYYTNSDDRWDDDSGKPSYYCIDPEEARKKLRLYPIPTSDYAGTDNLVLTYYPKPAEMDDDADVPLNGYTHLSQFHIALACWSAWFLTGYDPATAELEAKRSGLMRQYSDKVTEALDTAQDYGEQWRMKGGRYYK